MIGIGQYIIRPEYEHLRVSPSKWFMLNDNQKQTVLQRFHHASVEDMTTSGIGPSSSVLTLLPINHSDNGDVASLPLPFTTSNQPNDEKAGSQACSSQSGIGQLSISIEDATNTTGLPILFLRQAWSKAAELLTEKKVLPAPCSLSRARIVESKSMQRPHFVSPSKHDELLFECDPGFIQRYICSHTVAAAEDNQLLNVYLEHFGKFVKTPNGNQRVSPNFSRLSMSGLPRGSSGKKRFKSAKKEGN